MKKILGWFQYNENKEEKEEKDEETNEECKTCKCDPCECEEKDESFDEEFDFDTLSLEEKKNLPKELIAYMNKKKGKKGKKDEKSEKGGKGKPDFLDLDKDGDKKETMKKAAKDAKKK
jgi:hypothetical protein